MAGAISAAAKAATEIPLSLALSGAGVLASYLNARLGLSYDLPLLTAYTAAIIEGRKCERQDRVNAFYKLEHHAETYPDRVFLVYRDREHTFRESYETVLKYGTWLKSRFGIAPGEVVAIDFMNSDIFVFLWLGLFAIGANPAFMNYNLTGPSIVHCVRSSTTRILLVDPDVRPAVTQAVVDELARPGPGEKENPEVFRPVETLFFSSEVIEEIRNVDPVREPDQARSGAKMSDMAALIFTSGTTGLPKPAIVSWTKMSTAGNFLAKVFSLGASDRIYTCMPLYHTSASCLALSTCLQGASTSCIGRKFSANTFWSDVRACDATIIQYVGETCRYLLSVPPSPLDAKHKVRIAYGNGLRPEVWNRFKARFDIPTILEFYAATEAPTALWNYSTNDFASGAVGRVGALCRLLIVSRLAIVAVEDPNTQKNDTPTTTSDAETPYRDPTTGYCQRVPTNKPGELLVKLDPANIRKSFQGYYRNERATSSKVLRNVFRKDDAWFRTGDLMRADADGRWYFSDRLGDTFRWKAENISTAEVGSVVGQVPAVADVTVYGVQLPRHDGRCGCAAVVLSEEGSGAIKGDYESAGGGAASSLLSTAQPQSQRPLSQLTGALDQIAEHVTVSLPRYAQPIFVRVCKTIKATGTNKQLKHELRSEGVDPTKVQQQQQQQLRGDLLFWLRDGRYVPFREKDWQELQNGKVKL